MTVEELRALPDAPLVERRLIHGQLVERPYQFHSPAHSAAVVNLGAMLKEWAAVHGAGFAAYGCPYLLRRRPDTFVCFDLSVVTAGLKAGTPREADFIQGVPVLAVEVMEPHDTREQVDDLIRAAMRNGVRQFWLVDPLNTVVDVFHHDDRYDINYVTDVIEGDPELPGLRCPVAEIFE